MIEAYENDIEQKMKLVYEKLSEKDKRLYAAIEVRKLPRGGQSYISQILDCNRKTIQQGLKELSNPEMIQQDRIRREGGGRKAIVANNPQIENTFLGILKDYTAGDPMNKDIRWTNLTHKDIAERLTQEGFKVSEKIAKQLLKKHGYVKRKAQKQNPIGSSENRNEQFKNIARLRSKYEKSGNPVVSIDTKKKSL